MLYMTELTNYINALDSASVKGETDAIREAHSNTTHGRVCQRILGNFWDDPELLDNLEPTLKVLTSVERGRAFLTNRIALLQQIKKAPFICNARMEDIDRALFSYHRIVKDSWVVLLEKAYHNDKYSNWFKCIEEFRDGRHAMSFFLTNGLYDSKLNVAAFCLMDHIEMLNYNFHSFCISPLKRNAEAEPILRRIDNHNTHAHVVKVLAWYRPDLLDESVRSKTIGPHSCSNPACVQCQGL